jgi:outer membrane protein assembly factor BamA
MHIVSAMRVRNYLISIIVFSLSFAIAFAEPRQDVAGVNARGVVESAEITGVAEEEISQEVREAVRKLIGQRFDQQAADDLVVRIQAEKPDFIATTRLLSGTQSDQVKVSFVLERSNEEPGGESNINSRYTVERVDVQGLDESKLSQSLRDEMKKLVGEKLDKDKANEIERQLNRELRPRHYASQKVVKGSDRQHIAIIYEIRSVRWIPWVEVPSQRFVYHSKQNFSADLTIPIPVGNGSRFLVGASDDQDELLERFAGFNLGFEMSRVGTDRLGVALRYFRYHERWQPSTVLADRESIYRERTTFDPTITFAFDPRFRLTAGISLSDLEIQYPTVHPANANATVASLAFRNNWGDTGDKHSLEGAYDFRAGNHKLDSDFIYTRHQVRAQYIQGHNKNMLMLSFAGGVISGNAPLFERFSLGNTATLRGWNKFDIAPRGGNRMVHASLQYGLGFPANVTFNSDGQQNRFGMGFHVFYDVGAVGDSGTPIKAKHSVGFGFGTGSKFFMELGFPIRSSNVEPTFTMGFRF